MADKIDISKLSDDVRKLYGLVNNHINNINGHPFVNPSFGGFVDVQNYKNSYFLGNRALGFPAGVTKMTDLNFGLYYGTFSQFTDAPIHFNATTALVNVEGWDGLTVNDDQTMSSGKNAPLKKITVLIGQTENIRYISSGGTYDSGWLNDEVWTNQTLMNGSTGHVSALISQNSLSSPKRVDIQFNLNGDFGSLKDIIQLSDKYKLDSNNITAFSGWGQTSDGTTKPAAFAVHGNYFIEYVHVADQPLKSVNGYFSFMTKSPTS